jgi:hypothetical protein
MRFRKRWIHLLIVLVCGGVGWLVTAYFRSPGYRAAQAYARIHQGMTPNEAHETLRQFGGEIMASSSSGVSLVEWDNRGYWFSDDCSVTVIFSPKSADVEPQRITEKRLRQQTFGGWLSSLLCSVKSSPQTYQSDPGERTREMLVEPETLEQICEEWRRLKDLERQIPSTVK